MEGWGSKNAGEKAWKNRKKATLIIWIKIGKIEKEKSNYYLSRFPIYKGVFLMV